MPGPKYGSRFVYLDSLPTSRDVKLAKSAIYVLHFVAPAGTKWKRIPLDEHLVQLENRFRSFVLPAEDTVSPDQPEIQPIDVLVPCAQKDYALLPYSVASAIEMSENIVTSVTVVAPSKPPQLAHLADEFPEVEFFFLDEESFLGESVVGWAASNLTRPGWGLQQLIIVEFLANHAIRPVLVIDADTILTRRKLWIHERRQLIAARGFNDPAYYRFLSEWGVLYPDKGLSYITHHQLMQPWVVRELLEHCFGTTALKGIIRALEHSVHKLESETFSLDFELYGQYLVGAHPELAIHYKWANQGAKLDSNIESVIQREKELGRLNSLSFHHYLQN